MFNINIISQIRITQHFLNFYFKQKMNLKNRIFPRLVASGW